MADQAHILVVEDDPYSQDMLVRRLAARGFRATAAGDGETGLALVAEHAPDLVLLDVNLPGISGLDVVRRLRTAYTRESLPVILVTALGETTDVVAGLEAGANDYVVKPVHLPVLLARVRACLQLKRSVAALVEAERDRVMLEAIGRACEQIAQPMTAITMLRELLVRDPPQDQQELRNELTQVLGVTKEAGDIIHRLRAVARSGSVPYTRRIGMLQDLPDPGSRLRGPPPPATDGTGPGALPPQ